MSRPLAVKGGGACSKHVLNTRLALRLEEHGSAGRWAFVCGCGQRRGAGWRMSADGCVPRRDAFPEHDPIPRSDRRNDDVRCSDVDALYRKRAAHLICHFTATTADRDAASDVVHEAFAKFTALSLARRLLVVRPDAYLYKICVNLIRDRGRFQQPQSSFDDQSALVQGWHNPFAQLESRDTLRRLEAVMLRLKPKTREIFLAKRLDGMSYAEIAERTGLSVKGVEKHMSKAIAMIDRAVERDRL
jgi:RNA polymerase sigma factor (sigma-70 family)